MNHGALICRNCFTETGIDNVTSRSGTEEMTQLAFVCPNCGSDSFAV
jgi:Zn finger protein HypA/HybF involved in hydrogenase expression